jgi:hypothetical protein
MDTFKTSQISCSDWEDLVKNKLGWRQKVVRKGVALFEQQSRHKVEGKR